MNEWRGAQLRPVSSPPKTRELWLGQKVCAGNPSRAQTLPTLWGLLSVCVIICRFWISELWKWTNDRFKKCLLLVWNPILLVNCWNEACLCHRGSVSHIITLWQQLKMPGLVRLLIPKDTESGWYTQKMTGTWQGLWVARQSSPQIPPQKIHYQNKPDRR